MELFKGQKLVIATMHGKEAVIGPLLQRGLGVEVLVSDGIVNTDAFGTFSGELPRSGSPLDAARRKCIEACNAFGCSLAVASEGSFGPHPSLFFAPADEELVLFMDVERGIEISATELSTATNFAGRYFTNQAEIKKFLAAVGFPEHALIARRQQDDVSDLVKGIHDEAGLDQVLKHYFGAYGGVFLETDMRAMHNPARMKVIEAATKKLIERIRSVCPSCKWPGFGITARKAGLPCDLCGAPTASILSDVLRCHKCDYVVEHLYPKGKLSEDPTFCDFCNP